MEPDQGTSEARQGGRGVTFSIARSIVVRGVAAIYLIAFLSWWVQCEGLTGAEGLAPLGSLMESAHEQIEPSKRWQFPTVYWLGTSDAFQYGVCALGVAVALAVLAGFLPGPGLLALWALYLSVVTTGQAFMRFQWDGLLLESGLLAAVWAPWMQWRLARDPRRDRPAAVSVQWLIRGLLFRLRFFSAAVKWASADPLWRTFRALTVHYETQPLPTWTAYWVHWLPEPAHVASCVAMFTIELGGAFLVFGPRLGRTAAFVGFLIPFVLWRAAPILPSFPCLALEQGQLTQVCAPGCGPPEQ
ncbi:MAG TPA: lipase maturation factor family protein [Verrucomicrobiales bacterium]|nr:lipase maturation factor family protein [Verrucomicrobiales bacterium]